MLQVVLYFDLWEVFSVVELVWFLGREVILLYWFGSPVRFETTEHEQEAEQLEKVEFLTEMPP